MLTEIDRKDNLLVDLCSQEPEVDRSSKVDAGNFVATCRLQWIAFDGSSEAEGIALLDIEPTKTEFEMGIGWINI